jgi:hypothetical protein
VVDYIFRKSNRAFYVSAKCPYMPDADAEGSYGDPSCGDYLTVCLALRSAIENYLNKNRTENSYENSNSSR